MPYSVYCHTNKINGKKYVGATSQSVLARWENGKHYSRHTRFYRDITKYGWDNFTHEVLYTNLTKDQAEKVEKELIAKLDLTNPEKGYNAFRGGYISKTVSDSTRAKLSKNSKGSNNPFYNRKHSNESKRIMSERKPKKAVRCIETNKLFKSLREAELITGVYHSDISKVCRGLKLTAGGYHWIFEEGVI